MKQGNLPTLRLLDLAKMLCRRWRVVLATAAVCTFVGIAVGMAAPKTYTATASLTVSPITTNPFSSAAVNQQINITTERAILSSGEVAAIAAKELGEKVSPGSLQNNTETAAPAGSQILEVSVTLPDAQKAADQANALAKAYLKFRSQGAAEVAAGFIEQLDERIKGLNGQSFLTDSQVQQLQDLIQQRTSLILASASPGRIIGFANAPQEQSSMGVLVFTTAGMAGGVLFGLSLALLWERTDPKVRTSTRMATLFANDLVLLNDEHQESVRWLVRSVRQLGPKDSGNPTTFVGVVGLPAGGPVRLTTWLAGLTRAHNLEVMAVGGSTVSAKAVDMGWPERDNPDKWEKQDVVYVEIDESLSGTRLADLAARMDILFITAGKKTPLGRVKVTQALVSSLPSVRVTPIYYVPSRRRRRKKHTVGHAPQVLPPSQPTPPERDSTVTGAPRQEILLLPKTAANGGVARPAFAANDRSSEILRVQNRKVLVSHRTKKGA